MHTSIINKINIIWFLFQIAFFTILSCIDHTFYVHRNIKIVLGLLLVLGISFVMSKYILKSDKMICTSLLMGLSLCFLKEGIKQRRSYTRESKQSVRDTYNGGEHPKRKKRADKAKRRLKTIANIQPRKLERKMTEAQKKQYEQTLSICKCAGNQQKNDKDKIYSLHKPFTRCIAKRKVHKQYE